MSFYDAKLGSFGSKGYKTNNYVEPKVSNYATSRGALIYFAHEASQRVVHFLSFLDSLTLDIDYNVKLTKTASQNSARKTQGASVITYNLQLNVPAESMSESRANLAKFQELMRYINTSTDEDSADIENASFIYVFFSNIIQNGSWKAYSARERPVTLLNWGFVRKYGVKTYITSLNFNPDLEMGFIETKDGEFLAKYYSVNMTLNVMPTYQNALIDVEGRVTTVGNEIKLVEAFSDEKVYVDYNPWPFGEYMSHFNANNFNNNKFYGYDGTSTYALDKGAQIGFADINGDNKWVVFKAFIEDYSFQKEIEFTEEEVKGSDVVKIGFGGGIKSQKYNLKLNVPAHSVNESRANLKKCQDLIRYGIKKMGQYGTITTAGGGQVQIYCPNFICSASSNNKGAILSSNTIFANGLLMQFKKLTIAFDMEMGFFDYNGAMLPKMFVLSFDLELAEELGSAPLFSNKGLPKRDNSVFPFGINYSRSIQESQDQQPAGGGNSSGQPAGNGNGTQQPAGNDGAAKTKTKLPGTDDSEQEIE